MIGFIVAGAVVLAIGVAVAVTHIATRLRYQCTCYTPRHSASGEHAPVLELLPPDTDTDPAGATRPDIRRQVTS
jgi:hypothetical protein